MARFLTGLGVCLLWLGLWQAPVWAQGNATHWSDDASQVEATAKRASRILTSGTRRCQRLQPVYRYDCYAQNYGQAAAALRSAPELQEAQVILQDVTTALSQTVTRNADPVAPPVRRGRQQFRAIKPETLPAAKQSFVASLQEAETRLLRSSSPASLHFTTIAQAINSNKVLLRALLSPVRGIWRRWAGTGELFGVRYLS